MAHSKSRLVFGALALLALAFPNAGVAQAVYPAYPAAPCPYGYYYNGYGCYPAPGYGYDYPWNLGVGLDFYDGGWYGHGWHGSGWHGGGGGFRGGGGYHGGGGGRR